MLRFTADWGRKVSREAITRFKETIEETTQWLNFERFEQPLRGGLRL